MLDDPRLPNPWLDLHQRPKGGFVITRTVEEKLLAAIEEALEPLPIFLQRDVCDHKEWLR